MINMIHAHIRLTEDLLPLDFSLGQEHSEDLEKQIESLIDDEVRLLAPCHTTQMAPAAMQALKAKVVSVLRLKCSQVVHLNITKDIPLKGMLRTCGGYWDAIVRPGPKEDQHLRRLVEDNIPEADNLSIEVITQYIGPSINFWRCSLVHLLYLIHVLLLARLLEAVRPLLLVTQSNLVCATICSADIISCTNGLSPDAKH
jgi:hypothetical protein